MSFMADVKSLVRRVLRAEEPKQMSASATVPPGASLPKDCSKNTRREWKWYAQSSANIESYTSFEAGWKGWSETTPSYIASPW
jgi:hypothetical protein